ncbi:MAG: DUF3833 domain-containing protein [Gammaproteobacteria bacterium]|nr:DUF3833 domain-containing protein [Gammaproteobacteria bacterium]MBU2479291.1 DUF3833 domain-containing protein [Gammaproteobacteria bacterium]
MGEFRDGEQSPRVRRIRKLDAHRYQGRADDVVGTAIGKAYRTVINTCSSKRSVARNPSSSPWAWRRCRSPAAHMTIRTTTGKNCPKRNTSGRNEKGGWNSPRRLELTLACLCPEPSYGTSMSTA